MEIEFKRSHYDFEIHVKADNVHIIESVEERIYEKDADGKPIYNNPKRDVSDVAMDQVSRLLDDMAYYRKGEYDSSSVIESLFGLLPEEKQTALLKKLNSQYETIE